MWQLAIVRVINLEDFTVTLLVLSVKFSPSISSFIRIHPIGRIQAILQNMITKTQAAICKIYNILRNYHV